MFPFTRLRDFWVPIFDPQPYPRDFWVYSFGLQVGWMWFPFRRPCQTQGPKVGRRNAVGLLWEAPPQCLVDINPCANDVDQRAPQ